MLIRFILFLLKFADNHKTSLFIFYPAITTESFSLNSYKNLTCPSFIFYIFCFRCKLSSSKADSSLPSKMYPINLTKYRNKYRRIADANQLNKAGYINRLNLPIEIEAKFFSK